MPYGYLISAAIPALAVLVTLGAWTRPAVLARVGLYLGFVNEVPLLVAGWLVASAILAAAQGDLTTPLGWVAFAISVATLVGLTVLLVRAWPTSDVLTAAVASQLGIQVPAAPRRSLLPVLVWPFVRRRPGVRRIANLHYGQHRLNTVDVYRASQPVKGVFVHLHGGGFSRGRKNRESLPLIYHLARHGWLCMSANYRLSPAASRADQLADVHALIHWVHGYAEPAPIVLAGGSAGAYLAALASPTTDDPAIAATVMLYAYYGQLGSHDGTAPPMLVLHGSADPLVPASAAREFVEQRRSRATNPVVYGELPGGGHTFDLFNSLRARAVRRTVDAFLGAVVTHRDVEQA
jgi:acetyl esterase/lipase